MKPFLQFCLVLTLLLCSCGGEKKVIVSTDKAPKAIGPYSQAVMIRNNLYISGQIGINPESGKLIQDSPTAELNQIMANHKAILNEVNLGFEDVVKVTIFLKDMNDYKEVNEAYSKYFSENPPARETVGVLDLPAGANIEISMIAKKEN